MGPLLVVANQSPMESLLARGICNPPIADYVTKKHEAKKNWETSFEENKQEFIDSVARSISKNLLNRFKEELSDIKFEPPSKKYPYIRIIDFDVTSPEKMTTIRKLAVSVANLPPFNEWFAEKNKNITDPNIHSCIIKTSKLVCEKIKTRFEKVQKKYPSFQYQVKDSKGGACVLMWIGNQKVDQLAT